MPCLTCTVIHNILSAREFDICSGNAHHFSNGCKCMLKRLCVCMCMHMHIFVVGMPIISAMAASMNMLKWLCMCVCIYMCVFVVV